MQTGITGGPPRPRPAGEEIQVLYTLDQHDFVDCWMYQWERASGGPESTPRQRLWRWVAWPVVLLLGPTAVEVWSSGADGGLLAGLALLVVFLLGVVALSALSPGPSWWRRRAAHLKRMKQKARELEQAGAVINRARIYWLFLAAGGITEISELRQVRGDVSCYEYREVGGAWAVLDEVVLAERHVFLVPERGDPWIVPLHCFPDRRAAEHFVEKARGHLRAAERAPVGEISPGTAHPEGLTGPR
jgi:hypothetical protein